MYARHKHIETLAWEIDSCYLFDNYLLSRVSKINDRDKKYVSLSYNKSRYISHIIITLYLEPCENITPF